MKIEIKNIDTFNLIKGFLELCIGSCSADSYDEAERIIGQMKTVPSTDANGNFVEGPLELCKMQWEEYEQEFKRDYVTYSVEQKRARDMFFAQIGEAMGPVCYAAWQFKQSFNKNINTDWIDKCIKYYEDNVANS